MAEPEAAPINPPRADDGEHPLGLGNVEGVAEQEPELNDDDGGQEAAPDVDRKERRGTDAAQGEPEPRGDEPSADQRHRQGATLREPGQRPPVERREEEGQDRDGEVGPGQPGRGQLRQKKRVSGRLEDGVAHHHPQESDEGDGGISPILWPEAEELRDHLGAERSHPAGPPPAPPLLLC